MHPFPISFSLNKLCAQNSETFTQSIRKNFKYDKFFKFSTSLMLVEATVFLLNCEFMAVCIQ